MSGRNQKVREAHFTFNGEFDNGIKNTSLNCKGNTSKSIPQESQPVSRMDGNSKTNKNKTVLPINFFHSPGEYNKMLIKCSKPQSQTTVQRLMGYVNNLQFLNEDVLEQQKCKRDERMRKYCESMRKSRMEKSVASQPVQNCKCCCCDQFCTECAKTASCEQGFIKQNNKVFQENLLIDIEEMKKKAKSKVTKKSKISLDDQALGHFCCGRSYENRTRIQELIKQTLVKQIEAKRDQEIDKLTKKQKSKKMLFFNNAVRSFNKNYCRRESASAQLKTKLKSPTKQQIREEYWQDIKDLVYDQLKKSRKMEKSIPKVDYSLSQPISPPKEFKMTAAEMDKLRINRGKCATKEKKRQKELQEKLKKKTAKKLLALKAEQAAIMKNNPSKKFRPSQQMLQLAFRLTD